MKSGSGSTIIHPFNPQGHHPWPNAKEWTDKELGIPDDLELGEEMAE